MSSPWRFKTAAQASSDTQHGQHCVQEQQQREASTLSAFTMAYGASGTSRFHIQQQSFHHGASSSTCPSILNNIECTVYDRSMQHEKYALGFHHDPSARRASTLLAFTMAYGASIFNNRKHGFSPWRFRTIGDSTMR